MPICREISTAVQQDSWGRIKASIPAIYNGWTRSGLGCASRCWYPCSATIAA